MIRLSDLHVDPAQAFWSHIQKGPECWKWTGVTVNSGHGRWGKRLAHRIVWERLRGPIPPGIVLCHRCDNPPCCNPEHIFLGTVADNNADKLAKGRQARGAAHSAAMREFAAAHPERLARGEGHGMSKLTSGVVIRIRADYATGSHTQAGLAATHNVARSLIGQIVRREIWRDL